MRVRWLAVGALTFAGCQTLLAPAPQPTADVAADTPAPLRVAAQPGSSAEAEPDDPLTLAAENLERGDHPAAAAHFAAYVRQHPDQVMFRFHLAELLLKLDRLDEAKVHFERFAADAEESAGPVAAQRVHCHTRLVEIGQRSDDRFAELLHRGAGLLLLVQEADGDDAADTREEMLCKAIRALTEAKELRPTNPRVRAYLADAHDRAGNRRAADAARTAARHLGTPGTLTPAEQRRLAMTGGVD